MTAAPSCGDIMMTCLHDTQTDDIPDDNMSILSATLTDDITDDDMSILSDTLTDDITDDDVSILSVSLTDDITDDEVGDSLKFKFSHEFVLRLLQLLALSHMLRVQILDLLLGQLQLGKQL